MQDLKFPLNLNFNIATISNDFSAVDASGNTIAYVRQKMFKLKEAIDVFNDESKSKVNYKIKADRWIDFSAAYSMEDPNGKELGKVARKGWRSIWKANYQLIDQNEKHQYSINEDNAWVKVLDGILGEIPILGFFTGYVFNPTYSVSDLQGKVVVKLKKQPSFFGRKFVIEKLHDIDADDQQRILLGLMMMVLLERRKG